MTMKKTIIVIITCVCIAASLNIDYEDILAADSFHADLLEEE